MAAPRKRALPFILPCGKFRLGCILTARLLRNMHRNLFLPLSAGIQRVVRAVPNTYVISKSYQENTQVVTTTMFSADGNKFSTTTTLDEDSRSYTVSLLPHDVFLSGGTLSRVFLFWVSPPARRLHPSALKCSGSAKPPLRNSPLRSEFTPQTRRGPEGPFSDPFNPCSIQT